MTVRQMSGYYLRGLGGEERGGAEGGGDQVREGLPLGVPVVGLWLGVLTLWQIRSGTARAEPGVEILANRGRRFGEPGLGRVREMSGTDSLFLWLSAPGSVNLQLLEI